MDVVSGAVQLAVGTASQPLPTTLPPCPPALGGWVYLRPSKITRARSRAPRDREYPTVYITWKLLYILATSFCELQQLVRAGWGHFPCPHRPPAPPPRADLDLELLVIHPALGGISPRLPPGPAHPLPIGPTPLEDEVVRR